jgi:pyridoxine 5-phosphate synthase
MPLLGVNIDHFATVRQARYRHTDPAEFSEPTPLDFALLAQAAGVYGITVHLREDRRHIQEHDVRALKKKLKIPLNLEMAVTPAMTRYAQELQPEEVCLVPENRQEVTTEGGLDLLGQERRIRSCVRALQTQRIRVSLFIDPDSAQIEAAARIGAEMIELHTGAYSLATKSAHRRQELTRHQHAAKLAHHHGLIINAGHGLRLDNLPAYLTSVPHLHVLNIGHSLVSRSLLVGWKTALREMIRACRGTARS